MCSEGSVGRNTMIWDSWLLKHQGNSKVFSIVAFRGDLQLDEQQWRYDAPSEHKMSESQRNGHCKEPFETIITPKFWSKYLVEILFLERYLLLHPGLTHIVILTFGSVPLSALPTLRGPQLPGGFYSVCKPTVHGPELGQACWHISLN